MKRSFWLFLTTAVFAVSSFSTASAGILRDDKGDDEWEILLTPYLWGVSIKGDAGPGGSLPIDASFGDILSNLNMALSLHTEFHRGKWGFVIDPTYLHLEVDIPNPGPLEPKMEAKIWLVEAWGSYKFVENWEVLAGVRYQDQKLTGKDGLGDVYPPLDGVSIKESWTDVFGGLRTIYPLGEKWIFTGRGDIAFAGDSERSYNLEVFFNRRIGKTMAVNLGYRYFRDDYDNKKAGLDNFVWDVKQTGPVIGYTWAF